jgi:hypothetical protein
MQALTYYLLKVALSVLLLFVIGFSARELYRLWFVQRITLTPFAYFADGAESEPKGKAFTQRVYQNLRDLQRLLEGDGDDAPDSTAPPAAGAVSPPGTVQAITLEAPVPLPSLLRHLDLPELKRAPLSGIELKVQGVDLASLGQSLFKWLDPPEEIAGNVVEADKVVRVLVEMRRVAGRKGESSPTESYANLEEAALATAAGILYLLAADQDAGFKQKISRTDFDIFTRAVRLYGTYRHLVVEMRPKEEADKAPAALDEADRLAAGLVDHGVGKTFGSVYLLGAITASAKLDFPRARRDLERYLQFNPNDQKAQALLGKLPPIPKEPPASQSVQDAPKARYRPVQPGVSVSSVESTAGTICCLVRSKREPRVRSKKEPEKVYLLSTRNVFQGKPGTAVVQPGRIDGGSMLTDQVAQISKTLDLKAEGNGSLVGSLAEVLPGVKVSPKCDAIGAFNGTAEVGLGERVTLVGRTSGKVSGKVVLVQASIMLSEDKAIRKFDGLIGCQRDNGGPLSMPGDSGGLVVNERNELVGMSFAGSPSISFFAPIKPILDALEVELVTGN